MAGYIVRVVTVTYAPRYQRLPWHTSACRVNSRRPTADDVHRKATLPVRTRGFSGGPCGSCARPGNGGDAWTWLLAELADYAARWGRNPLGAGVRLNGTKVGKRGRGSQDYLFT